MSRLNRALPKPTLDAMVSPSSSTASLQLSQSGALATSQSGAHQVMPCASYVVSESGAQLTLGGAYHVTSTGLKELQPAKGGARRLAGNPDEDYELTLAAGSHSAIACGHVSELDFDNGIQIGRGSSGKVYNVLHVPSGIRVCVKQMQIDDSRHREEVRRELDSLHKAQSRFIVDFYGAFFHNDLGVILLVLELMEGSLHEVIRIRGPLAEREAKAFALQVVHGLSFLHNERHVIHRDIKPSNLLFHRSGQVKITDFGVSSGQRSQDPSSVTTFVGSILYMSPERLEGRSYGAESDIWSLGITLCDAVAGCHPYQEAVDVQLTFWDLLQKVLRNDPALHRSPLKHSMRVRGVPNVDALVSDDLDSFVAECLAFDRAERSSADRLLDHPWLRGMTLPESEEIVRHVAAEVAVLRQQQGLAAPPSNPTPTASSSAAAAAAAVAAAGHSSATPAAGLTTSGMFEFAQPAAHTPNHPTPEESRQRSSQLLNDLMASVQQR